MSNFSYTYVSVHYFFTSKFHHRTLLITCMIKGLSSFQSMQITIYQHFSYLYKQSLLAAAKKLRELFFHQNTRRVRRKVNNKNALMKLAKKSNYKTTPNID